MSFTEVTAYGKFHSHDEQFAVDNIPHLKNRTDYKVLRVRNTLIIFECGKFQAVWVFDSIAELDRILDVV